MPPPVTPSPHRFLGGGQRRAPSPTKDTRPAQPVRDQISDPARRHGTPAQQAAPSSQFAPTPRFSSSRPKAALRQQRSPSPQKPALVRALQASGRPAEDVEDAPVQSEDDEMLDIEHACALPTTEDDKNDGDSGAHWTNDLALSPKRRRLADNDGVSLTARPTFKQPQTPASHLSKTLPQFSPSQAQSTEGSTTAAGFSYQRPAFVRSSAAPQESGEPLPETFSPHKRGQKFVPGGMAATMQQWVIETGQAAVQSRKGQGYLKGDDYVLRVKIEQCRGDGPFTVRGRSSNGDDVNVLLAGNGGTNVSTKEFGVDSIVGIRAPTWELELDSKTWTIGVDWRTLQ
ncbi:hypothetical protein LTR37_011855 [Vermiconidia calcicola]|uniref:Uncharacterized protein n=1 Tax=Vermiconidia calcicola TaxID=1690605 RepID=A0ACC3N2Q0_9PEZI|nr:hypothetical protein LTR37_011855 [Vermiconidia calcicola]